MHDSGRTAHFSVLAKGKPLLLHARRKAKVWYGRGNDMESGGAAVSLQEW